MFGEFTLELTTAACLLHKTVFVASMASFTSFVILNLLYIVCFETINDFSDCTIVLIIRVVSVTVSLAEALAETIFKVT